MTDHNSIMTEIMQRIKLLSIVVRECAFEKSGNPDDDFFMIVTDIEQRLEVLSVAYCKKSRGTNFMSENFSYYHYLVWRKEFRAACDYFIENFEGYAGLDLSTDLALLDDAIYHFKNDEKFIQKLPSMVKSLKEKFGDDVIGRRLRDSPVFPRSLL